MSSQTGESGVLIKLQLNLEHLLEHSSCPAAVSVQPSNEENKFVFVFGRFQIEFLLRQLSLGRMGKGHTHTQTYT